MKKKTISTPPQKVSNGFLVVVYQDEDSHSYLFQSRKSQKAFVSDIENKLAEKGLNRGTDFKISMSADVVTLHHS